MIKPIATLIAGLTTTYVIGLVTSPYVGMVVKPILRGAVRTTVVVAVEMKKIAAEVAEDFHDIATEAGADLDTSENEVRSGIPAPRKN